MELKVVIDGLERSVSGITDKTTCSQIIYALAHATSQRGRFVMVEKYRNIERRLAPNDQPLETLKKWREHSANVTFQMLRVDANDEICRPVEEAAGSLGPIRNASTSSMVSSLPGKSTLVSSGQLENGQRSTSSLPTYNPSSGVTGTLGRHTRRPPPPDYKSVMEQKSLMMTKSVQQDCLEFQKLDISQLGENIKKEEVAEYIAYEEELRQLLTQQKNLRQILQPMIASNWPEKYQQEMKRSQKLKASLEATKEAIDKTRNDIIQVEKVEKELLQKLPLFEEQEQFSSIDNLLETSIDLNCSGTTTPQKVIA